MVRLDTSPSHATVQLIVTSIGVFFKCSRKGLSVGKTNTGVANVVGVLAVVRGSTEDDDNSTADVVISVVGGKAEVLMEIDVDDDDIKTVVGAEAEVVMEIDVEK